MKDFKWPSFVKVALLSKVLSLSGSPDVTWYRMMVWGWREGIVILVLRMEMVLRLQLMIWRKTDRSWQRRIGMRRRRNVDWQRSRGRCRRERTMIERRKRHLSAMLHITEDWSRDHLPFRAVATISNCYQWNIDCWPGRDSGEISCHHHWPLSPLLLSVWSCNLMAPTPTSVMVWQCGWLVTR